MNCKYLKKFVCQVWEFFQGDMNITGTNCSTFSINLFFFSLSLQCMQNADIVQTAVLAVQQKQV